MMCLPREQSNKFNIVSLAGDGWMWRKDSISSHQCQNMVYWLPRDKTRLLVSHTATHWHTYTHWENGISQIDWTLKPAMWKGPSRAWLINPIADRLLCMRCINTRQHLSSKLGLFTCLGYWMYILKLYIILKKRLIIWTTYFVLKTVGGSWIPTIS